MFKILVWFVGSLATTMVLGQQPSCYKYDDEQLGSNTVYNLCEFNNCIYAATENGIVKIDQGKTTILRSDEAVKNSYTLFKIGPDGHLYTLNFRNQIYRVVNNKLELYKDLRNDFPTPVKSYFFYKNFFYVSSQNAIRRYNLETLKEDRFWNHRRGYHESQVFNDTLHIGTYYFVGDSLVPDYETIDLIRSAQSGVYDHSRILRHGSNKYVAISGYINSFSGLKLDFAKRLPNASNIHYLKSLDEERIWLSTNAGALILNPQTPNDAKVLFPELSISYLLKDRQGKIWVATLGGGIIVIPDIEISYYPSKQVISAFTANDDGNILVGTETGAVYPLDGMNDTPKHQMGSKVYALYTKKDSLYVSHLQNNVLFTRDKMIEAKQRTPKVDRVLSVNDLMVFSSWHGTHFTTNTLEAYNKSKLLFEAEIKLVGTSLRLKEHLSPIWVSEDLDAFIGLHNSRIKASSSIVVSTNVKKKEFIDLHIYNGKPHFLTSSGEVWIYDQEYAGFEQLFQSISNGLCERLSVTDDGVFIYENGIIHHFQGNLKHSFVGLSRFKHEELIDFRVTDKNVYVVYRNGVHEIPIGSLSKDFEVRNLSLELLVDNKVIREKDGRSLDAGEESVVILFNYFDEILSPEIQFFYQLNGGKWNRAENQKSLRLDGLSAGNYTVKVKIVSPVGPPVFKSISFQIKPHWYESTWFRLGVALLVIALIVVFFLRRIKALRKKQKVERKIVEAQLAKINAQMKPHFIFNVLTSIQSLILKEDKFKASNAIGEFAQFIRQTLEISKYESITLREELDIAEQYIQLEQQRQIRPFDYHINVSNISNLRMQYKIPPLILQPYIENAIIHGLHHLSSRKGQLDITIEENDHAFRFTVLDNGVGRQYQSKTKAKGNRAHYSFANSANLSRISLIKGGRVRIDDLEQGTRVILEIPINYEDTDRR